MSREVVVDFMAGVCVNWVIYIELAVVCREREKIGIET